MRQLNNYKTLKLNIGSGRKRYDGFTNIDKISLPETDVVVDLEKGRLPFSANSVSEILCEHCLEHINNFLPLMEEMHRVCKPGAKIAVAVPYYKYEGAFRDPTHVRFFSEHSFDYFCNGHTFEYYSKTRFNVKKTELRTNFKTNTKSLHKRIIKFVPMKSLLNLFLWGMYSEIYFELEVVK